MPVENGKFGIYKIYKKETDIWREGFVKQIDINENVEYNKKITVVRIV